MSAIGGPSGRGQFDHEDAAQQGEAPAEAAPGAAGPPIEHPLAEKLGSAIGLGLGVVVTEGLRLAPGWDKPVLGSDGKFVSSVPGAVREGDYAIRKRHQEVVGPQVAKAAANMAPGLLHDLVAGFGEGATRAPGASYHLDAELDAALNPKPGT